MTDLNELDEGHKQSFARVVSRWAKGDRMQFRVDPTRSTYGSSFPWHDMREPKYMPNFQYRALPCDD